jgi:hypothetical protein
MAFLVTSVVALALGYAAYRAIKGGFERPQSVKLNGYGIFGLIVLAIWLIAWAASYL